MAFSFVGRRRELEACREWLAQSSQGRGRLVALCGEAGMGKTRLMDEFARSAAAGGHTVAWSQMIEDPVAPPYLPWTLALRSIAQQFDDEALRNVLGSGATDVASLLPEIEDRLGIAASTAPADAAVARFRLFDSITRFLLGVARRQPLILLFDNLHLADRSTLQLLEYHCRQITASATLIVIAYRVSDVDEAHPLHAALSRVARTVGFENIELPGLTRAEVARLLHAGSGRPADPSFVDRLVERSDGNPLYVCEVASELRRAASETTTGPAAHEFRLPDSLREVIAARIDALPADTVQLLRTAAVLGRDFDLALLSAVAHGELESIDATLEAARSTGVTVALDAMRCRFTHALFRELLYEQSSRAQRTALHRAAAVALERRLGHGDDPPMAQLAYHYFEAAQSGTGSEAVIYCRRAGEDALARRAYGEAVQQFERALQITERAHDPDPLARFEILTALGDAQWRSGSVMQAAQTLLKPALIAHRLQWWNRLPQAVLAFQAAQGLIGTAHVASVALHRAALAHTPPTELAVRARLLASLSMAYCYQPDAERSVKTLEDAVRIARELGDPDVLTSCLQKSMWVLNEPAMAADQEAMLQEALAIAQQSGDELELLRSMTGLAFSLLTLGRVAELESLVARLRDCATRARDPHHMNIAAGFSTALAILAGRWAEAARQAMVSVRQAALQDTVGLEGRFGFQMFAIQRARGQLATIAPLLKQITGDSSQRLWLPGQILLHYELGQADEARAALERLDPLTALPRDGLYAISLVYLAEACSGLKDQARCRVLQAALQPFRSINVCLLGTVAFGSGARYLALLAVALRRPREARELFEEALEFNSQLGAEPLIASTLADYAALLVQSDLPADQIRARELIGRARSKARTLEMHGLLARLEQLETARPSGLDLTDRELAVLRLIAAGESNKRIAGRLFISENTVATHIRQILRKTGARNRTEAVAHARQSGLISAD